VLECTKQDFAYAYEKTYDHLSKDAECGVLSLRNTIAREIFPNSIGRQIFFYKTVWPRVELKIRDYGRVTIRNDNDEGGKDVVYWKFNKQSRKGRRLRKKPFSHHSDTLRISGLVNPGNNCYIHVVVQILYHNAILRNYFLSGDALDDPQGGMDEDDLVTSGRAVVIALHLHLLQKATNVTDAVNHTMHRLLSTCLALQP